MCGIVGVIGTNTAAADVLNGLKKLEYRGYDSAGIAVKAGAELHTRKEVGKIGALEALLQAEPFPAATAAIGHTRWATHGVPSKRNSHPHCCANVAVVHNGIIENYQELKAELQKGGANFLSDTDTETLPILLSHLMSTGMEPLAAVQAMAKRVHGAFALGILFAGKHDMLMGTRRGAPLCVGLGKGINYLASDPLALAGLTDTFIFLAEDDIAVLTPTTCDIYRPDGTTVKREKKLLDLSNELAGKAGYRHFMLKEINEQPSVVSTLLTTYLDATTGRAVLPKLPCTLSTVPQINIVACGTAYLAGMVGKYYFEQLAGVPVNVDVASEFRYRQPPFIKGGVFIAVSQSGETADTLAALEHAKAHGQHIITITNTPTSSMARAADVVIELKAGREIAVASTKAYMAMLVALAVLALKAAEEKGIAAKELDGMAQALRELPAKLTQALSLEPQLHTLAQDLMHATSMLYLGRGLLQPLAYEGALKMKEISYIHAEAYASGEMKHGPIALVDEHLPVINLATTADGLFDKTVSNMKEIEARRGRVVLFTDALGVSKLDKDIAATARVLTVPASHPFTAPMLFAIPLQLLAYHVATSKGTDVDQPRNLAKSVTVE
ncbi:MAG: glutamine--fructose-6-phosphate transaminase (isomerizing) [Alphaproteobacteria bacterium]